MSSLTRRRFLRQAAAACALAGALPPARPARAAARPNIVFVLTDDQGPWALGHSGNGDAHTPNLDAFFREGAYLTNHFVATPVCSPSRASLVTSRYGTELGITDWIMPPRNGKPNEEHVGLAASYTTWPKLLAAAGYNTGLVGKWHLGTRDAFHPSAHGYGTFAGFREGGIALEDPTLEIDGKSRACKGLTVDILTDLALEFLRAQSAEKPFLLSLHYRSPHAPWRPVAPEDAAPYDASHDLAIPNPGYPLLDTARVDDLMRQYLASVSGVDRNFARVLAELEALGFAGNTVVVFSSDHGYNIGHHGLLHKGNATWITTDTIGLDQADPRRFRPNLFDTSLRTPTAVRWPGVIRPGSRIERVTSNLDWFPTLLAMAGLEAPPGLAIHGRNMLPLLEGESVAWDDALYGEYSQHHYTEADLRMYRTREWKLVRDFKREGHDELYRLAEDPNETVNLIGSEEAQGMRSQLNEMLLAKMRALGDPLLARV